VINIIVDASHVLPERGMKKKLYSYNKAKELVLKLGITSSVMYKHHRYLLDGKLPANPYEYYVYRGTWLGWDDFLFRRRHEKQN